MVASLFDAAIIPTIELRGTSDILARAPQPIFTFAHIMMTKPSQNFFEFFFFTLPAVAW